MMPPGFQDSIDDLLAIREIFQRELARAVEPRLNSQIEQMPRSTVDECRLTAARCNEWLRRLGLAIRDPRTGRAGVLLADAKAGHSPDPRFRIQTRSQGQESRTNVSAEHPRLELIPAEPSHAGGPPSRLR